MGKKMVVNVALNVGRLGTPKHANAYQWQCIPNDVYLGIMPECHCPENHSFYKNGDLAQRVRALVFSARRCCHRSRVRALV
jgi:hypothetical protein